MAWVIKCDRCGKLFEYHAGDINGIALLNVTKNTYYINRDKYDLCPDCWKSWKDWFKRGKAQEKEKER